MRKLLSVFSSLLFLFVASPAHAVSLSLSPETTSQKSTNIIVDVFLDTEGKKATGVDFLASYDKEKLKLVSVKAGSIFDTYTSPIIDNANGKVGFSGLVKPQSSYVGSGKFAQLLFEPLKNGAASVEITFKKGERNDSNVADTSGNDILTTVDNATVTVSGKGGSWFQNLLDVLIFWD